MWLPVCADKWRRVKEYEGGKVLTLEYNCQKVNMYRIIKLFICNGILRATTKKIIQKDTLKNTTDKSKQNLPKCSRNPRKAGRREQRKKNQREKRKT